MVIIIIITIQRKLVTHCVTQQKMISEVDYHFQSNNQFAER